MWHLDCTNWLHLRGFYKSDNFIFHARYVRGHGQNCHRTKKNDGSDCMNILNAMKRKISEVMTRDIHLIAPSGSVEQAAQTMKEINVGLIPVVDGTQLLGTITDRDIAIRVVAENMNPSTTRVSEVMSSPVVTCFDDQTLKEVAALMEQKQIRRIVVLNRTYDIVGIASLGDLVVKSGREKLAGQVLEKISEPVRGQSVA